MTFHRALPLLFVAVLFVSACKKPTLDDTRIIPDDNLGVEYTDTLTLRTANIIEDSIDVSAATLCLLGSMNDPLLGQTTAGFYVPFRLTNNNLVLDDTTVTIDSIVLMMWYFNTYGDWRTPQTVEVYEMTEAIDDTAKYFSDKTFAVEAAPVGSKTFIPDLTDTITIGTTKYPPSLRLRLDNTPFGQKFIDASGTTQYANNAEFRNFFKGLYITTQRSAGEGLVAFDPYQNGVRLTIYYHDVQDSASSYDFPADPGLVVNHYTHNYTNSIVNGAGEEQLIIQGLGGVYSKVTVPSLMNLGNILINKAQLEVTVLPSSVDNDTLFAPPARLILVVSDSAGNFNGATPDQVFPATIFGGNKVEETDSASGQKLIKYKFSLSRYYQEVISHKREDYGIFILPDRRYQIPDRLVAGGGSHPDYRVKLNLTYEQID